MKIILQRNDDTSIFCGAAPQYHTITYRKVKLFKVAIGCSLLIIGAVIIILVH